VSDTRFADNAQRYANRLVLNMIVNMCFGALSVDAVLERLQKAKIANMALNDVADLSIREFLNEAQAQIGGTEVSMAAFPIRSDAGTPVAVPTLDHHGDTMRLEFGQK
jgi:itaconate CoA-transferase